MGQPGLLSALQTAGDRPEASAGPGGRRPLLSFAPCVRSKTNIPETEMGPAVPQTAELARWGQNWALGGKDVKTKSARAGGGAGDGRAHRDHRAGDVPA
uniref:Uncharacterized protein n=1 Tax=Rangifer tarandus platyrhynchus TaxID=3082113 RepID=A0ACB0EEI3_RANTA|nr:unnamed protein product [Rangifer tarandus platyrhynchus]